MKHKKHSSEQGAAPDRYSAGASPQPVMRNVPRT
jgi:hypothetical protein